MIFIRLLGIAVFGLLVACTQLQSDPLAGDPLANEPRGRVKLEQLFDRGQLRPATQADIDAYNAAATAAQPEGRLRYVDPELKVGRAYVVLQPVVVSLEWNVINGRNLIVPVGVRPPDDPFPLFSHYFLGTGFCTHPGSKCPGAPKFDPAKLGPQKPVKDIWADEPTDDWRDDPE